LCRSAVNLTVHFNATYDLKKLDDGKVYMMFSDYDCQFNPRHAVCRMENLFNGNKQLGKLHEYEYQPVESQNTSTHHNTLQLLTN
jgi:Haemolymph juvenile hormone binding protein (JHBP).